MLAIQAETSRQRRSVRAEETASKASVKMFGPILLIFLVVMFTVFAIPLAMVLLKARLGKHGGRQSQARLSPR